MWIWIAGRKNRSSWAERISWFSFSGGMLGLLLIGLLVWVGRLDPRPATDAPGRPWVPTVVRIEHARGVSRIPELAIVVSVPLSAVLRGHELAPYCFVAGFVARPDGDGDHRVARVRPLKLGRVLGRRVEVRGGLEPGEPVLIRGQHRVHDGDAIWVEVDPLEIVQRVDTHSHRKHRLASGRIWDLDLPRHPHSR